ncbi:MAG: substrate-binding domain-containing protein [Pseudolabrys sp.]
MTSRKYLLLFLVHGFVACGFQSQTYSDELKIFTSRAVATVLEKIGPEFEKNTGHTLNITTGLSSEFVGRIIAGEAFDVVAAPPPVLDGLVKSEKVTAESKTGLVRSPNGVAVRTGAPKPDISSLESFKRALLDAKSITYLPVPGVPQIIDRLGLKEALAAKTTIPKTDLSSELVAKGEVDWPSSLSLKHLPLRVLSLRDLCRPRFSFIERSVAQSARTRNSAMLPWICSIS